VRLKNSKLLVGIIVLLALVIAFTGVYFYNKQPQTATFNGHKLQIILADSEHERVVGLSGKKSLPSNSAMLFDFKEYGNQQMWMKDMKFAIDIAWLNADGRVLGLKKGASPGSYPEIFSINKPARYVLELNSGSLGQLGISEGSTLNIR
jgi:uncharacterized protein